MKELLFLPDVGYNQQIIDQLKKLPKTEKIGYVSLNKTYKALIQSFNAEKIPTENIYFIDLISPSIFKIQPVTQCVFLKTLDLNVFADELLNMVKINKITTVIFDSVSSMLIYKKNEEITTFFDYVLSFIEELKVNIILVSLYEDSGASCIKQLKMRVDTVKEMLGDR